MSSNKSIYEPPESNVESGDDIPESFYNGKVSEKTLDSAIHAATVSLVLFVPMIYFLQIELSQSSISTGMDIISALIGLFSEFLWLYILYVFGLSLNVRFKFHAANKLIIWAMGLSAVLTLIGLMVRITGGNGNESMGAENEGLGFFTMVYFICLFAYGVVNVLLGRLLLTIEENYSQIKMLAWCTMISGICLASILLFILALPFDLLCYVALINIFKTMQRELRTKTV